MIRLLNCHRTFPAVNYTFSAVPRVLTLWKESLAAAGRTKTAEALADPTEYEDMFPDLQYGLQAEEAIKASNTNPLPASAYTQYKEVLSRDIIAGMRDDNSDPM